jgi:hypothetical protein
MQRINKARHNLVKKTVVDMTGTLQPIKTSNKRAYYFYSATLCDEQEHFIGGNRTVPYGEIEGLQLGVDGLDHLKKTLLLVCLRFGHLQLQKNQIILLSFYVSPYLRYRTD